MYLILMWTTELSEPCLAAPPQPGVDDGAGQNGFWPVFLSAHYPMA
jgi:hypothetical protein